jgi:hypothetical protein
LTVSCDVSRRTLSRLVRKNRVSQRIQCLCRRHRRPFTTLAGPSWSPSPLSSMAIAMPMMLQRMCPQVQVPAAVQHLSRPLCVHVPSHGGVGFTGGLQQQQRMVNKNSNNSGSGRRVCRLVRICEFSSWRATLPRRSWWWWPAAATIATTTITPTTIR